jgi:hypothetical protein
MNESSDVAGPPGEAPGFWRRQFRLPVTHRQLYFDLCFGIVAPVLCAVYDPAVFRGSAMAASASLGFLRLFGYLEIGLGVSALVYYFRTRRGSGLLAGALCGGSIFSFAVGVYILPLSIIGLILIVGVFGFTPFVTSFVFLRNSYRCRRQFREGHLQENTFLPFALGTVLILAVPLGLQVLVSALAQRAIMQMQSDSEPALKNAVRTFGYLHYAYVDDDEIVIAYEKSKDDRKKNHLASAYQALEGRDIEERIAERNID